MSFLDHVVGSFSVGAADNPTVAMMDAAFATEQMPWRYVNCEVEPPHLDHAVAGAWAMGWQGFNCSMPHKQTVIPMLTSLSSSARICHAVNCVRRTADGWEGHNTDGIGFVHSVQDVAALIGGRVLVIGAGGAAYAIAVAAAEAGAAEILVAARTTAQCAALAELVNRNTDASATVVAWSQPLVPPPVDLIVNATPVGMHPGVDAALELDLSETTASDLVVADVVFNPADTAFLRRTREQGATTVDGTGMLVNQAAENIRLWTGATPDLPPMRRALEAALEL
ncbi:MAG: shikimate dehydrogenase [Actinomycetota bacterium]